MAGCYGNTVEDRYFESVLFRYLEELDMNNLAPWRGADVFDEIEAARRLEDPMAAGVVAAEDVPQ